MAKATNTTTPDDTAQTTEIRLGLNELSRPPQAEVVATAALCKNLPTA